MSRTVSTIDYRALAERLKAHAECHANVEPYDDEQRQWAADLRTVVSLLEGMTEQAKADAVTGYSMLQWIKLTDRMPNPDEHGRVLIFTAGYDFNGEQVFDVKAETLNECFYADPDDQPEVCRVASHWMPHPTEWRPCECESQYDD